MNIWTILGIKSTAGTAAIKKAYARLAAECHIERDPKGFQRLHEAYAEAMEIAKEREKKLPKKVKDQPESKPTAFRTVPKNLHKLGPAGPVNEEESPAQEESDQSESLAYQFRPPQGADAKPEEAESQNKGYSFPKGGAPGTPSVGTPKNASPQIGEYQFPKGETAAPPPPENEETGGASGYAFPRSVGKPEEALPDADAPHQVSPKQDTAYSFPKGDATGVPVPENTPQQASEYQFLKSSPDAHPPSGQSTPLRGYPAAPSGATIFPGILPLENMDIPIMPLPLGPSEEYFPQTKEEADRLALLENARNRCLEDMQVLLERSAPEQAWYPVLLGADFTLVQYSGKFLLKLQNLCLKQLPLEMASALYTAYGFASNKSLRKYPVSAALHSLLNTVLGLPQEDIPLLSLSEILHRSDTLLGGLDRLCKTCFEPYICEQALQAQAFTRIQHQPYFIFKLAAFLKANDVPEEWYQALANTYQFRETPTSPCLQVLAEQLPTATEVPKPNGHNPAADTLLLDAAALDAFYATARKNVLELVQKTRKAFPQSTRRMPWEYVFTHPEFTLVRRDVLFLVELLGFLREGNWPAGIWLTLTDVYATDFAALPAKETAIQEPITELSPEEQVTTCLMMLRHILETPQDTPPENPSFWKIVKSMLRSI